MADTRRRPGPKPRGPFQNKRLTLTTRITEDLRKKLEAAAADSGRSLSQEIELRLQASLTGDQTLADALGGKRAAALLLALAAEARLWGDGERWLDDYSAFNTVRAQWDQLLDRVAPKMPGHIKQEIDAWDLMIQAAMRPEIPAELRDRLIIGLRMATRGKHSADRRKLFAAADELARKFPPAPATPEKE